MVAYDFTDPLILKRDDGITLVIQMMDSWDRIKLIFFEES